MPGCGTSAVSRVARCDHLMSRQTRFDYVVVGAGSAGCCLARRLSESGQHSVCLIEAGPSNANWRVSTPVALVNLMGNPRFNWMLESTPQPQLNGRRLSVPRGKTLGGSSSINSMVYIRGRPGDYDNWAAAGCAGWDWNSVLPYFRKSEKNLTHSGELHGDAGPLIVGELPSPHPLCESWAQAGEQAGIGRSRDFNGESQEGLGTYQVTMNRGRRWSSADAFLRSAPENLTVMTGAEVERIAFTGNRADAVLLAGDLGRIEVSRELVLSAGAVGSPSLLLASGVGPGAELSELGIDVVADVPGMGDNLQEHPAMNIFLKAKGGRGLSLANLPSMVWAPFQYLLNGSGLFSTNHVEAGGFARTRPELDHPDVQFHMIPARVGVDSKGVVWGRGFYADVCVLKPKSRGRLWLEKDNGRLVPRIDYNALSHPDDREGLIDGFLTLRKIVGSPALQQYLPQELSPGPGVQSREEILEACRQRVGTAYHPVGTCRMGSLENPESVVNPRLQVRDLENVRVADASIMPEIVAGNTNAPTIMLAEKASDLILEDAHS